METKTSFVLSHNFQLPNEKYNELREGSLVALLSHGLANGIAIEGLVHPHWRAKITAPLEPIALARLLGQSLRSERVKAGESDAYTVLLLGGRKDQAAQPGSPLQAGMWGVDMVETTTPQAFLSALSWEAMKASRALDAVFEVWEPDCQ
ncbi:DUF2656 family protein [Cyanobium sp. ATX 6F1]|uniref:DUF2656 family protein n=1 Tax=unclassified Cyanobium TaxID=2627006 RepID=UPI0020CBDFDE|nr:DUF2656 family protein [Cyanobium sp. ATX 6F1]MCP9917207.1 DUF2656 family protein [Cyanobium sp. ATX 6F1]